MTVSPPPLLGRQWGETPQVFGGVPQFSLSFLPFFPPNVCFCTSVTTSSASELSQVELELPECPAHNFVIDICRLTLLTSVWGIKVEVENWGDFGEKLWW